MHACTHACAHGALSCLCTVAWSSGIVGVLQMCRAMHVRRMMTSVMRQERMALASVLPPPARERPKVSKWAGPLQHPLGWTLVREPWKKL